MSKTLYVVGSNEPGFLPDGDLSEPMDWEDAVNYLIADMRQFGDDLAENADPDPEYDRELSLRLHTVLWDGLDIDLADPEDQTPRERAEGVEILYEGRCFFIAPEAA